VLQLGHLSLDDSRTTTLYLIDESKNVWDSTPLRYLQKRPSDADSTTPPKSSKLTYRAHHKLYRPLSSLHISTTTASQEAPILLQLHALRAFLILKCSVILDAQALAYIKRHLTTFHANQPPQSCQGVDHAVAVFSLPPDQRLASVLCY